MISSSINGRRNMNMKEERRKTKNLNEVLGTRQAVFSKQNWSKHSKRADGCSAPS
jgi:hypothetical protein